MTLTIPDHILKATALNEHALLVELACHLFNRQLLTLHESASLAEMSRTQFEDELRARKISVYRLTLEDFEADLATLKKNPVEK